MQEAITISSSFFKNCPPYTTRPISWRQATFVKHTLMSEVSKSVPNHINLEFFYNIVWPSPTLLHSSWKSI